MCLIILLVGWWISSVVGWWISSAMQDLNISVKRLDDRLSAVVEEFNNKDSGVNDE